jgi:hypothetical protein
MGSIALFGLIGVVAALLLAARPERPPIAS